MFSPAISPADPNLMMINCDMSATYISQDGGRNWRMIHHTQLRTDTRCRPAFHPLDPNVIYASSGGRLRIGRHFLIKPSWEKLESQGRDLVIEIDEGDFGALGHGCIVHFYLASGSRWSSFSATANRKCAFIVGMSRCGLSGFLVTSPPPWNDAAAPTRSGTAAAVRNAMGPPMQYPCVPIFRFLATDA